MSSLFVSPYALPIVLLITSTLFMTTAWYWHLRFKDVPLWHVVLISWWHSSNTASPCRPIAGPRRCTPRRSSRRSRR